MLLNVACPCGKTFTLPEQMAGRRGRCKACKAVLDVPAFVPTDPHAPLIRVGMRRKPAARKLNWLSLILPLVILIAVLVVAMRHSTESGAAPAPLVAVAKAIGIVDGMTPMQRIAVDYLKKFTNDPASLEIVVMRADVPAQNLSVPIKYDRAVYFVIRDRNEFGALVTTPLVAMIGQGRVVYIHRQPAGWEMERLYNVPDPETDPIADSLLEMLKDAPKDNFGFVPLHRR